MIYHHHHHHVILPARISLTISRHLFHIVHRSWWIFQATFSIDTELLYIGSSWSSCLCLSMERGPQEYIAYKLVLTSPLESCMSSSSNMDNFRDGCLMALQLLFCGVFRLGPDQYSSQDSSIIAVSFFFSYRPFGAFI